MTGEKKIFRIIMLLFSMFSCICVNSQLSLSKNSYLFKKHEAKNLKKDIDFAFKKIKKLHPNLYQYISEDDLDRKIDSVKNSITTPLTSREFYFVLVPLISEIRQGHNTVYFPVKKNIFGKSKKKKNKNLLEKFKFKNINGEIFVSETNDKNTYLIGAEILKIDEFNIQYLINKYNNLNIGDGYNKTYKTRTVERRILNYYILENQNLDSINLTLQIDSVIFDTTFYRMSHYPKEINPEIKHRFIQNYDNFTQTYSHSYRYVEEDSSIVVLEINKFENSRVEDFYSLFFNSIDSTKTKNLIIDLRNNPGGSLSEIHLLGYYLYKSKYSTVLPQQSNTRFSTTKSIWRTNENPVSVIYKTLASSFTLFIDLTQKPSKKGDYFMEYCDECLPTEPTTNSFKGNIFVLVNGNSFSASCVLAAGLQGSGRAIIVGEETGGAYNGTVAGVFKTITLPYSKLDVRFGLNNIKTPYTESPDGYGVIPDYTILPSKEHFLNGIDTELEWIKKKIKEDKIKAEEEENDEEEREVEEVEKEEK